MHQNECAHSRVPSVPAAVALFELPTSAPEALKMPEASHALRKIARPAEYRIVRPIGISLIEPPPADR
jgi:hypothetical protein